MIAFLNDALRELKDIYTLVWGEDSHDAHLIWRITVTPAFLLLFVFRWALILADRIATWIFGDDDDDHWSGRMMNPC